MRGEGGFEDEFPVLRRHAYRTAFGILGRHDAADDAACEALARAWLQWSKIAEVDYRVAWVKRVTANIALNMLRKQRGAPAAPPQQHSPGFEDELVARLELAQRVIALPMRQREVVALHHLAELTDAEVATIMNISPNSVKKHLQRGLAKLRLADTNEVNGDTCPTLA